MKSVSFLIFWMSALTLLSQGVDDNFIINLDGQIKHKLVFSDEVLFLVQSIDDLNNEVLKFDLDGNSQPFENLTFGAYNSPFTLVGDTVLLAGSNFYDLEGNVVSHGKVLNADFSRFEVETASYLQKSESLILTGHFKSSDGSVFYSLKVDKTKSLLTSATPGQGFTYSYYPAVSSESWVYLTAEYNNQQNSMIMLSTDLEKGNLVKVVPGSEQEMGTATAVLPGGSIISTGTYFSNELHSYLVKTDGVIPDSNFKPEDFNREDFEHHPLPVDITYYRNDSLIVAAFFADNNDPCYTEEGNCYQFELRVLDVNTGETLGNLSLPENVEIARVNNMHVYQEALYLTGDFVLNGQESNVLRYWLHAPQEEEEITILGEDHGYHKLSVYPNPVSSQLTINSDDQVNSVSLFDLSGKEVVSLHNPDRVLSLSHLQSGTYVMIINAQDRSYRRRIIKK